MERLRTSFWTKLASGWRKPDGLFEIQPEEVDSLLLPLAVGRLPGVGKVTGKGQANDYTAYISKKMIYKFWQLLERS